MSAPVRHEPERQRFVVEIDGAEAVLEYRVVDATTRDYRRTFVPEALRGRGIATELVRHALDDALAAGVGVVPTCPFVARLVDEDPRYAVLRVD